MELASGPQAQGLSLTEAKGDPHPDSGRISEERIRAVVVEFYRRARHDDRIGPVFDAHVEDWDVHLARMVDFWSAALLRSGRYSGNPLQKHRAIPGLTLEHFDRWVALFETTVQELCSESEAAAFVFRAHRMREAMSMALRLR
jgi:hemoglobin